MWAALKGARETTTRLTVQFQLTFVEGSSRFCALLSFPREQRERPPQPTNVGEDFEWDSTAPCFGTARQKVSLLLPSGMTHADECTQMDNRILYGV